MSTTNISNPFKEPPITSIGIVNLAWSLILNISIEERDIKLGTEVLNIWKGICSRTGPTSNINAIRYLDNISCLLFSFVESIAFERYFYYQYAHTFEKKRMHSIEYWNDLADMTSFSKDGIVLRITSFLGVGGGFSILDLANSINNNIYFISTFFFWGFIGLIVGVLVVKFLRADRIKKIVETSLIDEQKYWEIARKKYAGNLKNLFYNVQKIQELYYPEYSKTEKLSDYDMVKIINKILPHEKLFNEGNNKIVSIFTRIKFRLLNLNRNTKPQ